MKKPYFVFYDYKSTKINNQFVKDCSEQLDADWKNNKRARLTPEKYDEIVRGIYMQCLNDYETKHGKRNTLSSIKIEYDVPKPKGQIFDKMFFEDMELGLFDED